MRASDLFVKRVFSFIVILNQHLCGLQKVKAIYETSSSKYVQACKWAETILKVLFDDDFSASRIAVVTAVHPTASAAKVITYAFDLS
jgi:hypothetical protein